MSMSFKGEDIDEDYADTADGELKESGQLSSAEEATDYDVTSCQGYELDSQELTKVRSTKRRLADEGVSQGSVQVPSTKKPLEPRVRLGMKRSWEGMKRREGVDRHEGTVRREGADRQERVDRRELEILQEMMSVLSALASVLTKKEDDDEDALFAQFLAREFRSIADPAMRAHLRSQVHALIVETKYGQRQYGAV